MENTSPIPQPGDSLPAGGMSAQNSETGGDAHVAGDIDTGGGDFVGRDKHIRSIIIGRDVNRSLLITGDHNQVFVGDYERLQDAYINPGSVFDRANLKHFTGREWLLAEVDSFLHSHDCGYFILEAEAGLGKTAFMAWLAKQRNYIHHFSELAPGQEGIGIALRNLAAQLALAYELRPEGVLPSAATRPNYLYGLLEQAANQRRKDEKIVLVIDALDEAGTPVSQVANTPVSQNVLGLPPALPEGVYFLVSQRPASVILSVDRATTPRCTFYLAAERKENLDDMRLYLKHAATWPVVMRKLQEKNYTLEQFVSTLLDKSCGLFIYLHYVVHEVNNDERSPLDLQTLPNGLVDYYARYWQRWRNADETEWDERYLPLLTTLAAAQEAISCQQLIVWSGAKWTEFELRRLLGERWRPFLAIDKQGLEYRYRFYHATLQEFFDGRLEQDKLSSAERALVTELADETRARHARLAERYLQAWGGLAAALPGLQEATKRDFDEQYGLRHLVAHLEACGRTDDLHRLLAAETTRQRNVWYEVKKLRDLPSYSDDIQRAWGLARAAFSSNHHADAASSIGRQCRYACMISSLNSLAHSIPPTLLIALVDKEVWSWRWAMPYVNFVPVLLQRLQLALDLSPTKENELNDWLKEINRIASDLNEFERPRWTRTGKPEPEPVGTDDDSLTGYDFAIEKVSITAERETEWKRQAHLRRRERLTASRPELDLTGYHEPFNDLVKQLQNASLSEREQIEPLCKLLPYYDEEERAALGQEILEKLFVINAAYLFADTVKLFAPYLPASLQAVLTALCKFENTIQNACWKVMALTDLIPYLSGQDSEIALTEALYTVEVMMKLGYPQREEILAKLIPLLPEKLLKKAAEVVQVIGDGAFLGKYDPFEFRQLFPYLPEQERLQAWNLCTNSTPSQRTSFLQEFGFGGDFKMHFPGNSRLEALVEFAPIATSNEREIILQALLAEVAHNEYLAPELLTQLVKAFPQGDREVVVKRLLDKSQMAHIERQAPMLGELLPFLPEESVREQILRKALAEIPWNLSGEGVIQRVAPVLSESLVLAILGYNWSVKHIIPELYINFSDDFRLGFHIDKHLRLGSSHALIMRLAELGHAEAAYKIAKEWKEEGLATLALTRLSPPQLEDAFDEFVRQENYRTKLEVLEDVVKGRDSETNYLNDYRLSGSEAYRAIMAEFCIRLAASGNVQKALEHMPQLWSKAQSQVVTHLEDREKARDIAQAIFIPQWRARALIDIAEYFKDEEQYKILRQALEATLEIDFEYSKRKERRRLLIQLASIMQNWPKSELYKILWKDEASDTSDHQLSVLDQLSKYNREHMVAELCCLAPILNAIGGPKSIYDTLCAIADVRRWWP